MRRKALLRQKEVRLRDSTLPVGQNLAAIFRSAANPKRVEFRLA